MGAMEIISFSGAVVIGFAVPIQLLEGAHVYRGHAGREAESEGKKDHGLHHESAWVLSLFLFIGYNFMLYGLDLIADGRGERKLQDPLLPNCLRSRPQLLP